MKNIIIILSFFAIVLTSCEKKINLDNKFAEQKLVLNAILEVDSSMKASIYKSNLPLKSDYEFQAIKDATVEITDKQGNKSTLSFNGVDTIKAGENVSFYNSIDIVQENKEYTIEVNSPEFGKTTSTILVPLKPIVNSLTLEEINGSDVLKFDIVDNGSTKDFYSFTIEITYFDIIYEGTDTISYGPFTEAVYFELDETQNKTYSSINDGLLLSDKFFNGKTFTNELDLYSYEYYDDPNNPEPTPSRQIVSVDLSISNINEAYYNYLITIQQQLMSQQDPFSEVTFVSNNIENGLGVFGVKNSLKYELEL